ncbi:hypothetical protein SK069_19560 [Patulibacter brassicae]|uniref:Uncharacterized protein n=1 Tax=Patulibacter brassicae TaxID=1705717 RepID=A0ABU4VPL3_9ACTN|nr:hypothetical protein [Patulibacter brassicae]MDX8153804.1 hypothetical protein [Patulibacter brassicae]
MPLHALLRTVAPGLLATAVVAATAVPAGAAGDVLVEDYRTRIDLTVAYEHVRASEGSSSTTAATYRWQGAGPDVVAQDGLLRGAAGDDPTVPPAPGVLVAPVAKQVRGAAEGNAAVLSTAPDGTAESCRGVAGRVEGFVVVGRTLGGPALVPTVGFAITTSCARDAVPDIVIAPSTVTEPGMTQPGITPLLTARVVTGERVQTRFEQRAVGTACPGYDPASSTRCVATWTGTVTFERWRRTTEPAKAPAAGTRLGPARLRKAPAVAPGARSASTTVRCSRRCTVEALIGVFGQRAGKPHVTPLARRTRALRAGRASTLRVPLSAKARRAVAAGTAVMRLTVRSSGARRSAVYPLR